MEIDIPFIDQTINIDLPPANLLFDVSPIDIPPVKDFKAAICQALQNPLGTPPLNELVRPGWKVVLVSDDNTRPTPVDRIVPILLDFFNQAGVPDAHIEIIISSGTHRAMTQAELAAKYGPEVLARVRVLPHHYQEPEELVNFGVTRRGVPIWVNRRVVEADFRMAVGNIVPHHPAGWSGGAKAVLPGVAGEETVSQMHLLGSRHPALGEVDSEMRREMEDFAAVIGLDFILNVVLNRSGDLVGAVAGHYIAAHRAGVQISRAVYGVPIPGLADLTISSTSPVDFDFFQGDKGITSAEKATRPGGEILLVSGCIEGISPAHPELADYVGRLANDQIWNLLAARQVPDPLTAAEAIVINDIMASMKISIVSRGRSRGLSPDLCRSMGMFPIEPGDLSSYLAERIRANPTLKIGILRKSTEILPFRE
jgi:nickel-dependent lactate racemase